MSENVNHKNIQWFPGHMARTLRVMEQEVRHVDVVLILLGARIPRSSLNPEIERITAGKPHLYLLNKADLADPDATAQWVRYFTRNGDACLAVNSKKRSGGVPGRKAIDEELAGLHARGGGKGKAGGGRTAGGPPILPGQVKDRKSKNHALFKVGVERLLKLGGPPLQIAGPAGMRGVCHPETPLFRIHIVKFFIIPQIQYIHIPLLSNFQG